ncbi:MAG: hypothetical protein ACOVQA_04385, partial [Thermoflexibacteraceae bacterium]
MPRKYRYKQSFAMMLLCIFGRLVTKVIHSQFYLSMFKFFTRIFAVCCLSICLQTQSLAQKKLYVTTTIQKIVDFQDKRQIDSLALFLAKGTTEEKIRAMLAFGSIQNPQTVPLLAPFLNHENDE